MCGRFKLTPDAGTRKMLDILDAAGTPRFLDDIAPGAAISIIHQAGQDQRQYSTATWWLLLDPKTLKPNYKYASFNSRSDKLNQPRSASYTPYRQSRCLVPASAFIEGLGDKHTYHMIESEQGGICFGGLYRTWQNRETGEHVYSASIITLPPIVKWEHIHPKSIPLMLDYENSSLISEWLDPDIQDTGRFESLLTPSLQFPQRITPIGKPSQWNRTGPGFVLNPP